MSDVQKPRTCIQNRLLNTLNRGKIRLNNANKFIFLNFSNISAFFYNIKNWVFLKYGSVKTTFNKLKNNTLKTLFDMKYPRLQIMYNHMVGRAGSIPSPLYFMLLDSDPRFSKHRNDLNCIFTALTHFTVIKFIKSCFSLNSAVHWKHKWILPLLVFNCDDSLLSFMIINYIFKSSSWLI